MGLREQAALDAQSILEDTTSGFGWPFVLTSPQGVASARVGFTTDIGQTIDPDTGQAVAGRRASVAVSLRSLPEMPVAVADSASKPWIVGFLSVLGVGAAWKVIEVLPDRAAGVVVLLLEAYQQAIVVMSASVLALPSLLLSGSFAPVVALSGALALPSLQLAGELAPVVELGGALALSSLELSGELTPAVELDGALVLPTLRLEGAVTPAVELGGPLVLPSLQLSGELSSAVALSGALVLPSLQLAGSFTVAWNPQIVSATPTDFNNNSTNNPTAGPWSIPLPTRAIGDRLIMVTNRRVGDGTDFSCVGWTLINAGTNGSASSSVRAVYRDITAANVADANAVVTSTQSGSASQCLVWRLSGCDPSVAPVANGLTQNLTAVGTVNPPVLTGPNSGAVQRNLWLVYVGIGGQQDNNGTLPGVMGWPAGYGNIGTSSTTQSSGTTGVVQGWGSKVAVAGSDDPSTWTYHTGIAQGRSCAINICNRGVQ